MTIGGKVQPTLTARGLYQKSADIGWLALKPLFEAQADARALSVYFSNFGAGATLRYPGGVYGAVVSGYTSVGCDWMLTQVNPHTNRPFASAEEVARCHPEGEVVPAREYNPMDQAWLQEIVQSTNGASWQTINNGGQGSPTLIAGRGVFDRWYVADLSSTRLLGYEPHGVLSSQNYEQLSARSALLFNRLRICYLPPFLSSKDRSLNWMHSHRFGNGGSEQNYSTIY